MNSEPKDCNTITKFRGYVLNQKIRVIDYKDQVNHYKVQKFFRGDYNNKIIIDFEHLTQNGCDIKTTKFIFINIDDYHSYFSISNFLENRYNNKGIEKLNKRKLEILVMLKEIL